MKVGCDFFLLIHIPLFLSKYASDRGAVTRSRRSVLCAPACAFRCAKAPHCVRRGT